MLGFYPKTVPARILDSTVNSGKFWVGSSRNVIGLDINPKHSPSVCGDNSQMPFTNSCFDVVIYDPPHIPNYSGGSKDFDSRFGLGGKAGRAKNYNFSHTYPPFLCEAYRVLSKNGILFTKLIDYVHNHKYQWAHLDFILAAREVGFLAVDCIIKARRGPIMSGKWRNFSHSRRCHAYWLVFRKP